MIARFGSFTLDARRCVLLEGERPIPLPPKAFDVLQLLVQHAPTLVSKDQIAATVWPDDAPSDASIAMAVNALRKALGETAERPRFIRTVPRRGYAFDVEIERVDGDLPSRAMAPAASAPATCWLLYGNRSIELRSGETTIGRDPASAIRLDRPSVSRVHARILVDGTTVSIEDLGSLNGTFVGGRRISGRVLLQPGDTVAFGDVVVTFQAAGASGTPTRPLRRMPDTY